MFLQFALVQYALQKLAGKGFRPVIVPVLVRDEAMYGTGFFPTDMQQVYRIAADGLNLVGTSEVPLAALHMDEILDEAELPVRYVGYSSCFRREAGAAGKDTRGIFRVHQFDKVEMFSFCAPDKSAEEHDFMRSVEEEVLQELGLPYRAVNIAAGDLGAPAAKKYDLEAWLPTQERYREVTSCSNCTDYQARRLKVRAKGEKGGPYLLHTLNGTVVARGAHHDRHHGELPDRGRQGRGTRCTQALFAGRQGAAGRVNAAGDSAQPAAGDVPTGGVPTGGAGGGDGAIARVRTGAHDVLVVGDVQRDFCPGGTLGVPGGDEVIPVINRLLPALQPPGLHPGLASHPSCQLLRAARVPRRLLAPTRGAGHTRSGLVRRPRGTGRRRGREQGRRSRLRETYSAFQVKRFDLAEFLRLRKVERVFVTGLATDYCVRQTALDAREAGFTVFVIEDAIRGVAPDTTAAALADLDAAGVIRVRSDQVHHDA